MWQQQSHQSVVEPDYLSPTDPAVRSQEHLG